MFVPKLQLSPGGHLLNRSVSGMGHTPNSRSFVSHSPGFEPAKIGPYKKRRQTNVDNSLDELSPHDYSGALNSISPHEL